jgi:AmmeMemoRadiSam system protein A
MAATDEQRQALLAIARGAIDASLSGSAAASRPSMAWPSASGIFVTVRVRAELRGCIGTLELVRSLPDEVARCALAAAFDDRRFAPVHALELSQLAIEISLLGPIEYVRDPLDPQAVQIGRHGLVVEDGRHRGLLLPQVAVEWAWDRQTFLAHTCRKAGLPSDAWQRGVSVYRFEAEVFGE